MELTVITERDVRHRLEQYDDDETVFVKAVRPRETPRTPGGVAIPVSPVNFGKLQLDEAISSLPPRRRIILKLFYLAGWLVNPAEITALGRFSRRTLYNEVQRAIQDMTAFLNSQNARTFARMDTNARHEQTIPELLARAKAALADAEADTEEDDDVRGWRIYTFGLYIDEVTRLSRARSKERTG